MTSNQNKKVSIIIPTYNEKENIIPLFERIQNSMRGQNYEVIIVDDDSPDGTAGIVEGFAKDFPVKLIVRKNQRGLASAVVEGFRNARGKIFVVMDGDGQHPPEKISEILKEISKGADIAIGSRLESDGYANFNMLRKIQSKGANLIAELMIHKLVGIKDLQSGFFALKKEIIEGVELKPRGYKILIEILTLGKYKIVSEIPIKLEKRKSGKTKLSSKTIIDYIFHILSLFWRVGEAKKFVKYGISGVIAIFISVGSLWFMTEFLGVYYLISGGISKGIATIVHFTASECWVFGNRNNHSEITKRCIKFGVNRVFF